MMDLTNLLGVIDIDRSNRTAVSDISSSFSLGLGALDIGAGVVNVPRPSEHGINFHPFAAGPRGHPAPPNPENDYVDSIIELKLELANQKALIDEISAKLGRVESENRMLKQKLQSVCCEATTSPTESETQSDEKSAKSLQQSAHVIKLENENAQLKAEKEALEKLVLESNAHKFVDLAAPMKRGDSLSAAAEKTDLMVENVNAAIDFRRNESSYKASGPTCGGPFEITTHADLEERPHLDRRSSMASQICPAAFTDIESHDDSSANENTPNLRLSTCRESIEGEKCTKDHQEPEPGTPSNDVVDNYSISELRNSNRSQQQRGNSVLAVYKNIWNSTRRLSESAMEERPGGLLEDWGDRETVLSRRASRRFSSYF